MTIKCECGRRYEKKSWHDGRRLTRCFTCVVTEDFIYKNLFELGLEKKTKEQIHKIILQQSKNLFVYRPFNEDVYAQIQAS